MENKDWGALAERYQAVKRQSQPPADPQRAAALLAELHEWTERVTIPLMRSIGESCEIAAQRLLDSSEQDFKITSPTESERPSLDGPWLSYVKIQFGELRLYIYMTRGASSRTYIHLLPAESKSLKQRRVSSQVVAFLVRDEGDQVKLMKVQPREEAQLAAPESTTVEEIVYRAFELMLEVDEGEIKPFSQKKPGGDSLSPQLREELIASLNQTRIHGS